VTPKLGLAGHKVDSRGRTLRLGSFLTAPSYPVGGDITAGLPRDENDLGNFNIGLCGIAAPGHMARWEDWRAGRPSTIDKSAVIQEYRNFGYDGTPGSDRGVYALDVMNRWRKVGLFGLPPIKAFAQVDFYDIEQVRAATFCLGGVFLCLNLPNFVAAGSVFEADTWDVADDDGGIAGGHMVWRYGDPVNSWGMHPLVTPRFLARYTFDSYAVVSERSLQDGRAYSGLDLDGLMRAVEAVTT
jgi:hypothetical protein